MKNSSNRTKPARSVSTSDARARRGPRIGEACCGRSRTCKMVAGHPGACGPIPALPYPTRKHEALRAAARAPKTVALTAYNVRITRTIEHHATVEVEACDEAQAIELAEREADAPHANVWREGTVIDQTADVKEI